MSEIRVAIVDAGNCARSPVQGVEYYRAAQPSDGIPGLTSVQMGDYHIGDLRFVVHEFNPNPAAERSPIEACLDG